MTPRGNPPPKSEHKSLAGSLSCGVRCYQTNLRARRPLPTKRTPAPSAMSAGVPTPPDGGSALAAGAGAGAGTGAGAGAALGGGGAAGAAFGGSGSHGALATTPPAFASITPSLHSASAFAPPAPAMFALASATTAGSSWARAGEAASRATANIAASNINFFISSAPPFRLYSARSTGPHPADPDTIFRVPLIDGDLTHCVVCWESLHHL